MNDREQVIFEKFVDDQGAFLTSLSLEDNPEVIIAIMGENLNKDHPGPADFGKQMSVSMPEKDTEKITEVTIWFSDQTEDAVLVPMDVGWSDIGSWSSLWDINEKHKYGTVTQGDVVVHNSINCYVRSDGRLIAIIGVDDLAVVDTKDAIMVAHRDVVQDVKIIA